MSEKPSELSQASTEDKLIQKLRQIETERQAIIEHMLATRNLVRGSLYESARKCGKPACSCASGDPDDLHQSKHLAVSINGKSKKIPFSPDEEETVTRGITAYGVWRESLAELEALNLQSRTLLRMIRNARLDSRTPPAQKTGRKPKKKK